MRRPTGALGFKIPEGAVERVARRPRWQGALQAYAVETARHGFGKLLDRGGFALDRLVVVGEGDAFAPAAERTVAQLGDYHHRLGFRPPADDERTGDRPALDMDGETD